LPEGALARFGSTYLKANFDELAFRDDGRELYSWKNCGLLRVHDAATGKVLRTFRLPAAGHSGVQFSAGGHFLTVGIGSHPGDLAMALTVWDTTTGKLHRRIEARADGVFFPWDASLHDGRSLVTVGGAANVMRLWDLESGTSLRLRSEGSEPVFGCGLSPDGKRLFVHACTYFQCWDVAKGKEIWRADPAGAEDLVMAPDGRALLARKRLGAAGVEVQLLDSDTGKPHPKLRWPPKVSGWPPRWGADSCTLLVPDSDAKVVQVWDLETGKERRRLPWACGRIAMSADGTSLVGNDPALQRWDLLTGKALYPSTADRGHAVDVDYLVCSPDGKVLVSADSSGDVRFWDLTSSRPIHVLHNTLTACLAFAADGKRLLIGTANDTLLVCDATSGKVLNRLKLEGLSNFHEERKFTHQCERETLILNGGQTDLSARAWYHGRGGVTAEWDLQTGKRLWLRSVKGAEGLSGTSPDGRLGVDWHLRLRDLKTGHAVGRLGEQDGTGLATNLMTDFSPDGQLIATRTYRSSEPEDRANWKDAGIEIWELPTRRLVRTIPKGWLVSFAPDGRLLAVQGADELWVWDVFRGKEHLHLRAPKDASHWLCGRIAFAPSGRALAMATEDGSILLWEVPALVPAALPLIRPAQLRKAWEDLGDANPAMALTAVAELADWPTQAVALVKVRLHPVAPIPAKEMARLVAALDDDTYDAREAAEQKLAVLGQRAWPSLREVLGKGPSPEARRRLKRLLDEDRPPSEEMLRGHRAIRVLELAGTPVARDVLESLGSGDPAAMLTQEAKAAMCRLGRRLGAEGLLRP
jgi:WD40 repeat protein